MQKLVQETRMIEDKFTIPANAQYNPKVHQYLTGLLEKNPDFARGIDVMLDNLMKDRVLEGYGDYFSLPSKREFLYSERYLQDPQRYRLEDDIMIDILSGGEVKFRGDF